jgi:hypothetical protein
MKRFGHIIKFERIRQNIKQVQLSDGICTPSYLIQYFEQRNDYRHVHKYTLKLANFYLNENRYKKATQLYAKANEFLALKEKRKSIEDI